MVVRSRGSTPRVRKSGLCNWLQELDKKMEVLSDRLTWSDLGYEGCPLFILTRYPKLGGVTRSFIDAEIEHCEEQISEDPITRCVPDGLGSHERKQLAALLLDTIEALKSYNAARRSAKRVNKLAREPGKVRILNKKFQKTQATLQELGDYAKSLDIQDVRWVADACLKKLSVLPIGDTEFYRSIKPMYPTPKDPVGRGMVQLYWFFRHGCGLSGDEAEVRVARIRNALWTEHGVRKVDYRPNYQIGESKGCDAVHVTVLRFKQGTSRRRTR